MDGEFVGISFINLKTIRSSPGQIVFSKITFYKYVVSFIDFNVPIL